MVKGFGKHGPLHNPHTYGYFQPVKHFGYLGDSLSGGAILYQGGAFPARFDNAYRAPAPTVGQHTTEVLRELLDLTDAELESLATAGITAAPPPS